MNKTVALVIAVIGLVVGACSLKPVKTMTYRNVTTDVFASKLKAGNVQLLDVRTKEEFDAGHLGNAINIDMKKADFLEKSTAALDKTKTIAVYCRSGRRSADAAKMLSEIGYTVINMKGGILKWESENKPVVK